MNDILRVQNVSKTFTPPLSYRELLSFNFKKRTAVRALDDVSFSVPKGGIIGILGPNGAGKTTLLKIIASLILPDKGTIMLYDYDVTRDDQKTKALVGLIYSQERGFYQRLTGRQNLEFFAALYGLDKKRIKEKNKELFSLFEVDYADRRFDTYSAGMKQRFALMRSLIHDPELLLLDEPTKSLDYMAAAQLRDFIKEKLVKQRGKTALFTTHHMDEAAEFCDYFIIMHRGKIYAAGSREDLRRQVKDPKASLGEIFKALCS